jgi:hypothetical protein
MAVGWPVGMPWPRGGGGQARGMGAMAVQRRQWAAAAGDAAAAFERKALAKSVGGAASEREGKLNRCGGHLYSSVKRRIYLGRTRLPDAPYIRRFSNINDEYRTRIFVGDVA